jgi:hypothetical protein
MIPLNVLPLLLTLLTTPPPTPAVPAGLPAGAVPESLWRYVSTLAAPEMKGRLTGSPSGRAAEDYVERAMRALPLEVHTQDVSFDLYDVQPPITLARLDARGRPERTFTYLDDYREVDFTGTGDVSGELVFVGYGIDLPGFSPYGTVSVKDRVALVLTGLPAGVGPDSARLDRKLDWAFRRGAKAVVVLPCGRMGQRVAEQGPQAKVRALDLHSAFHAELAHADRPAVFVQAGAAEALTGLAPDSLAAHPTPRALGYAVRVAVNGHTYPQTHSRNVIGVLRGSDPALAGQAILIGAHYDHIGMGGDGRVFCGAADNASGSAVVLEAARAFATCGRRPRRTLIFALWCGEEQGLYGSKHYVEQEPIVPLDSTRLMIQIDYLDDQNGPCISNVTDDETIQRFIGAAAREKRVIVLDTKGQCASDDCSFLEHHVPACRFIAQGEHHHQANDTVANLSRDMLRETADLVIEGIRNTAY